MDNTISTSIPLWRNSPPPTSSGKGTIGAVQVFPSGRQALTRALGLFGLGRKDRIAVPEWSSACVIAAVGRQAFPLSMTEVLAHSIPAAALVLYEQWGWPTADAVTDKVFRKFPGIPVVLDKVDSAPLDFSGPVKGRQISEIWSLSKALGLRGGGLLRLDGKWSAPEIEPADKDRLAALDSMKDAAFTNDIAKSEIASTPGPVIEFVGGCDLEAVYRLEAEARRNNLAALASQPAAAGWEPWMKDALNTECGPGIAPLFRGQGEKKLQEISKDIFERHGIEATPYHFNFSGDPLSPAYELCLATPVHGMLTPDILSAAMEPWT